MDRFFQLITKFFLIGGALTLLSASALASAYYVSPTGSDPNIGTSSMYTISNSRKSSDCDAVFFN